MARKKIRNSTSLVGVLGGNLVTTEADAKRNCTELPPSHPLYQPAPPQLPAPPTTVRLRH